MAKWTEAEDRQLLSLRAQKPPLSWPECAAMLGRSPEAARSHYRHIAKGNMGDPKPTEADERVYGIPVSDFLGAIKDKPTSRSDLSRKFDRSESTIEDVITVLKAMSYEIIRTVSEDVLWATRTTCAVPPPPTIWDEEYGEFIIGSISDTHFGSKYAQITNLRAYVKQLYQEGVRHVLFSGDLTAGHNVYRGQIHDLVTPSGPEQGALAVAYLPAHDGLTYYMIGGNHDFSFIKENGYNVVKDVASQRKDIVYLGFDLADVPLLPGVDVRLWHPMGGVPYAYSYRMQKHVEEMAFAELQKVIERQHSPSVRALFAGHLHIRVLFDAGPIVCVQVPCFEGQTPFLKRKGKTPVIGGFIYEFKMTSTGVFVEDWPRRKNFAEIPNDYLNYPVPVEEEPRPEPIFEWNGEKGGDVE